MKIKTISQVRHLSVYAEDGKFAGWPANSGIWSWGDELLVGFTRADHQDRETGHAYNPETSLEQFARSLDGGETWSVSEAYDHGITGSAKNHALGAKAVQPGEYPGGFDFADPDFAMTLRRDDDAGGASHFYVTGNRGHQWQGPYRFPNLGNPGILARTDYLVEDKNTLLAFLTASKSNRREGRVGCARTRDGGRTWQWLSWLDQEPAGFAIMPATLRLAGSSLLSVVRRRNRNQGNWLAVYRSDNGGLDWQRLADAAPDTGPGGNPPALVKLPDRRVGVAYGVRSRDPANPSRLCFRLSGDEGASWSRELVLRAGDGANWDMGYPRMARRLDGQLVVVYYYNHAFREKPGYRYIAATIFDPDRL